MHAPALTRRPGSRRLARAIAAGMACAAAALSAQEATVRGALTVDGDSVELPYVYVYADEGVYDAADSLAGDEARDSLEFLQLTTPTAVTIRGGSSDGETAILEVDGEHDGETLHGRVTLVLMDGRWIALESDWR